MESSPIPPRTAAVVLKRPRTVKKYNKPLESGRFVLIHRCRNGLENVYHRLMCETVAVWGVDDVGELSYTDATHK
jgi:hypothetical protein